MKGVGRWEEIPYKKYRFSTMTLGYRSLKAGIESEKIRHLFQNRIIHNYLGLQPQVEMLNNHVNPYVFLTPFRLKIPKTNYILDSSNSLLRYGNH